MMYLQVIKEINHLLITYLAIIIDELIIKFTGEKQTGGQTLSWNSRTLPTRPIRPTMRPYDDEINCIMM